MTVRAHVALLLLAAGAAPAWAREARFVVIVANNRSLTPGVKPLRYADDDAANFYELLAPTAEQISIFTVLDDETQRVHRRLVPSVESPTREAVLARLAEYNRAMEAARARGDEPVLELVLIGHGELTPTGEGYLSLLDGPFSRGDLYRKVIAPSKAAFNHVIIDACNSYFMVARRGGDDRGPDASGAIRAYLDSEEIDRYPNTGVILSTSRAQASHEWSVFSGGIFSHELRSALAGAADVNGDGRVEYSEVGAFVAAANLRIEDPQARLDVFVRAPLLDRSRPLADLGAARYRHFLRVPARLGGHLHLDDARGVRYLDLHKASDRPLLLALVDSDYYYLRDDEREVRITLGQPGAIDIDPASLRPQAFAARGAIEDTFRRHLFEVAYGPGFYRGYVASAGLVAVEEQPAKTFDPPLAAPEVGLLMNAIAASERRARDTGLRRGDDVFVDHLLDWARGCARARDAVEVKRTLQTLSERIDRWRPDPAVVERKLVRIIHALETARSAERAALAADVETAREALRSGDAARANAFAGRVLDRLEAPPAN